MEEIGLGILIGLGIAALKRRYRSAFKSAIKLGLTAGEAVKDAVYEGGEKLADLVAEAKHEIQEHRVASAGAETAGYRPEKPKPDASN